MARLETKKKINASQLGVELGRVPMRTVGPDGDGLTVVETDAVSQAALDAAVAGHRFDQGWRDPLAPTPTPPEPPFTDDERRRLRALLAR